MSFDIFRDKMIAHFDQMVSTHDRIFEVDFDKDTLYATYLNSFPDGTNPIFRERTEHDCSCCRHFIKDIGGAVFIDEDLTLHTMWEFETRDPKYGPVAIAMDRYIRGLPIRGIYLAQFKRIGNRFNMDNLLDIRWDHFYVDVPDQFVVRNGESMATKKGQYRDTAKVFRRSMEEISMDAVDTVRELIASNTLYKGAEWKQAMTDFRIYKSVFDEFDDEQKTLYAWLFAGRVGPVIGRIRNHSIGTLLTNISEGMDLDAAVRAYEQIVAPANYKRPKAIFTKKMLEDAQKKITDLGYMESLPRRYATLDDIRVNNILFSNKDAAKRIGGTVFDEMMAEAKTSPKKFDRVEEIPIEKFISDVLPTASELEAYVENRHSPNFMSVIAPVNPDAPSMFKWNNAFSWAYAGNITDSDVKQNVKNAGGRVDGVLRFSIQWNDTDEWSMNDLDAHCIEPNGVEIFFGRRRAYDGGNLDVDIIQPQKGVPAVENITWPEKRCMRPGVYRFFVHQYSNRGGRDGFRAEIEFEGQVFKFDYRKELRQGENVNVAEVTLERDGSFKIKPLLPSETISRDIWGIKTMQFVPVSVVMNSPNYWDEQTGIGHKHFFFILKGCANPEEPNGFYNEFLKQELLDHKRVLEALGGKMKVQFVEDQLSGIGFSSTKRNDLVVKVKGATERVMKIKF